MDAQDINKICANEACDFVTTGKCVEGNPLEDCTHLRSIDIDEEVTSAEPEPEQEKSPSYFDLGGSSTLSVSDASDVRKRHFAPIVSFLGQAEAGKTSLIAEIYDAFQYSAYEELSFAGSKTLSAFEKICHKVRASSKAGDLKETRSDLMTDPVFYHLVLHSKTSGLSPLLLADRSGETYREIADSPKLALDCLELRHASVFNLLVDGERLCAPTQRTLVISESTHLLQALVMVGAVPPNTKLNVVLTKLDSVDQSADKERAHSDFDRIVEQLINVSSETISEIEAHKIAARPTSALYPKGFGVENLVKTWLGRPLPTVSYNEVAMRGTRAIDRAPFMRGIA